MRILFDATVMQQPSTGIARATLGLYEGCLSLEPSIEITALHQEPLLGALPPKIQSARFGTHVPKFLWRRLLLPRYVSRQQHNIIHFPWNGNVPKAFSNATVVTTLHDILPLIIPGYFNSEQAEQKYRKRIQSDIDRTHILLTVSEYSKKQIMDNFIVRHEPVVIHHGPTIKVDNKQPDLDSNKVGNYFLYVGGYDSRKGIEKLLTVFINLHREKMLSSRLILTGSKNYFSERFKRLIDEGHQLGIVEGMGYVSDTVLVDLFSKAKALVYPSKYEGFGLPPLEAMSLGCPVITTRYTSIPEICGDAAYYVEPDNEKDFAEGLIALENNQEMRRELKIKGKKQAAKFSWRVSAGIFLDEVTKISRKAN